MSEEPESMCALDVGSACVKAVLLDRVGDSHRFVARGAAPQVAAVSPFKALSAGLLAALGDLEDNSGRRLRGTDDLPITPEQLGWGVDATAGTVSTGCLEVALASVADDAAGRCAEAALHSVPSHLALKITGREMRAHRDAFERFAEELRNHPPHVVILVGGYDRKPERAVVAGADALATAAALIRPQERPLLVYAGPQAFRPQVAAIVGERMAVHMVDNVAPDERHANPGPLAAELDALCLTAVGRDTPGMGLVHRWCGSAMSTVSRALMRVYNYPGVDVLAAEIGADYTVLARPAQAKALVQAGAGLGQGARALLDESGPRAIARWLPEGLDEKGVADWAMNKSLRPWLVAANPAERALELAFARECLAKAWRSARQAWSDDGRPQPTALPKADMLVIGGGLLARARSAADAATLLLDGLQPYGVCRIAYDTAGLGPALGSLVDVNPAAVRSVLEQDAIAVLGTVVAPAGQGKVGRGCLHVELAMPEGQSLVLDLEAGGITRVPLALGAKARAVIRPARPFDVGAGPGQTLEISLEGGSLGIIIDVRGRPLPDPESLPDRIATLQRWSAALQVPG